MSDSVCKAVARASAALLNGELEPAMHAQFVEHLSVCRGCADEFHRLRKTWDDLGEIAPVAPGPGFESKLRNRIEQASRRRRSLFMALSLRYAAGLFIVVAMGIVTGNALGRRMGERVRRHEGAWSHPLWEPTKAIEADPLMTAYIASIGTAKEKSNAK